MRLRPSIASTAGPLQGHQTEGASPESRFRSCERLPPVWRSLMDLLPVLAPCSMRHVSHVHGIARPCLLLLSGASAGRTQAQLLAKSDPQGLLLCAKLRQYESLPCSGEPNRHVRDLHGNFQGRSSSPELLAALRWLASSPCR